MTRRFFLFFISVLILSFSRTWASENLLLTEKVGFSPSIISWSHLPNSYSQPTSESEIDLDGDNIADLFVFLPEYPADSIKAFFSDGSFAWEFKLDKSDQSVRELGAFALAAFDVDSDGIKEIICGTNDLRLYALDAISGEMKRYIQLYGGCYIYSMTLGDVNGDGSSELIVACAGNAEWQRGHTRILPKSRGYIHVLDKNLRSVWQKPVGDIGILFSHFVFAGDLDGDGREEVMIPDQSGYFYFFDDNGLLLWTKDLKEINPEVIPTHVEYAMIADIDGIPENGNELIIAAEKSGFCLFNRDGQILWKSGEEVAHGQYFTVADVIPEERGKEILFFDKTGEKILLFTSYGKELWEREIGYIAVMGGFIDWNGDGTKEIIVSAGENIIIFDQYGELMERMDAPLSNNGIIANVFGDQREEYIAVAQDEFFIFSNSQPPKSQEPTNGIEDNQKEGYISTLKADSTNSSILLQNFPNPFFTGTNISYISRQQPDLEIDIYDIKGNLLKKFSIEDQELATDIKIVSIYWDGKNETGSYVPDGIYFCSIRGSHSIIKFVKRLTHN
jgi:hypothetical protein